MIECFSLIMDCSCQLCCWAKCHGLNVNSLGGCPKVAAVKVEQENNSNMSTINTAGTRPGNVANMIGRLSQHYPKPDVTVRKNQNESKRIFQARFSYDAAESDELTFPEGARIEGIEKGEEGWMKGKLLSSGKIGMFPLNFVEEIDDDDSRSKPIDSPSEEIKTTIQTRPFNKRISSSGAPTTELYANLPVNEKSKERAKVLYEYKAEQPDEISLPAGTFVNILRRQVQDDGWLEIEHNGKIGLFPENFIKLMPASTDEKQPPTNQPPTPPPIKPKPSTPSGSTTPSIVEPALNPTFSKPTPAHPPAPEVPSSTTLASTKIRDLQKNLFAGRQLPAPGDKVPRPKTIIGSSEPERIEPESNLNHPQERISHHPNRDRPVQPGKRPPSMYPSANVNTASDESVNQTTSFPVKESTSPVTVIKPALLPKTDYEVKSGIKTQEVVIVPTNKTTNLNSTTSIHSNPPTIVENHSDSPYVTRKEFDALLSMIKQLQKQVEELSNK